MKVANNHLVLFFLFTSDAHLSDNPYISMTISNHSSCIYIYILHLHIKLFDLLKSLYPLESAV